MFDTRGASSRRQRRACAEFIVVIIMFTLATASISGVLIITDAEEPESRDFQAALAAAGFSSVVMRASAIASSVEAAAVEAAACAHASCVLLNRFSSMSGFIFELRGQGASCSFVMQ